MPLIINLAPGETVRIGDADVTFTEKAGTRARLVIAAPATTLVKRLDHASDVSHKPPLDKGVESLRLPRR